MSHLCPVCCILTSYNFLGLPEQSWDSCEKQTKELESRLRELKDEVKDPLPVEHEELYKSKEHIKVLSEHIVFIWICSLCPSSNLFKVNFPSFSAPKFFSFIPSQLLPVCEVQLTNLHA